MLPLTRSRNRSRFFGLAIPQSALDLDFLSGTLDPRITFTRASSATFFGSNGLLQTAANDAPRFDYDPVTLSARGLLIEEQRTNLLTWSENFGDVVWTKANGSITTNVATAPNGTNTADKWVPANGAASDGNDDVACVQQGATITSGQSYVQTFYAKAAEFTSLRVRESVSTGARANVNLLTGAVVYEFGNSSQMAVTAESIGAGWWRIACQRTASSTSWRVVIKAGATGDGTSGILLWGAQLEAGAFPTSYIPTTSATATRAADLASMTGTNFSSWYNATEGTLFADGLVTKVDSQNWLATLRETGVDYMAVRGTAATLVAGIVRKSASANGDLNATVPAYAAGNRIAGALAYRLADYAFAAQGLAAIGNQTNYVIAPTSLDIAALSTTNLGNLHIHRIVYWPVRVPNSQLQFITA